MHLLSPGLVTRSDRPQFVQLGSTLSYVVSNVGAPKGTVQSPFLFTLYTSDFQYCSESCHLQKFSDDSAVLGCIRDGVRVQGTDGKLCAVVLQKSSASKCHQDKGNGNRL